MRIAAFRLHVAWQKDNLVRFTLEEQGFDPYSVLMDDRLARPFYLREVGAHSLSIGSNSTNVVLWSLEAVGDSSSFHLSLRGTTPRGSVTHSLEYNGVIPRVQSLINLLRKDRSSNTAIA